MSLFLLFPPSAFWRVKANCGDGRTMICIPVGGELLPKIGPTAFVAFFAGVMVLGLGSFVMARWACLEYRWKWNVKI